METIVVIYDVCNRLTDCLSSLTPITNKVIKYYLQIVLKITIRSYKNSAFYSKKQYIPIDVCLLIDASGSMAGDKRQAACYLAEHLLLTGKEKVAVVTFQERNSQVVVPFTRNQRVLSKGLATISPAGLTPLADGIMTAVNLIKENRVRNPLLVLITDGIPNSALWTLDPKADALEAAAHIPENKIRLICIGVESNSLFLEKLANRANGSLYLVDDLNRDNLINIVRHEKKNMMDTHSKYKV